MDVVGACFGRTGTKSLKMALEMLGFGPCHHMYELSVNPAQLPFWQAAAQGDLPDWSKVFAEYKACVDWPSARFWREIADYFPDAKVLMTVRDEESWIDSVHRTIYPLLRDREQASESEQRQRREMSWELIARQTFDERLDDRDHAMSVYRDFMAEVQRTIAPERLLAYRVGDGWEPLCAFLGVDVPDEPFPMTNTSSEFRARHLPGG
ncbi:MAG: sulfotransferase family protein [Rhodospirillaceae bacterium]|jgi:hypothetical protein|nr:sulfotransferase family protein [Rhodospirillaceae bacterium]